MRKDYQDNTLFDELDQHHVIIEICDEDYRSVHLPCEPFETETSCG